MFALGRLGWGEASAGLHLQVNSRGPERPYRESGYAERLPSLEARMMGVDSATPVRPEGEPSGDGIRRGCGQGRTSVDGASD